jgi:hypothetical protein
MSRQGSIFYDAPEALSALSINNEKDELAKLVHSNLFSLIKKKNFFFFYSQIPNHQVMVMMKVALVILIVNYPFHHN